MTIIAYNWFWMLMTLLGVLSVGIPLWWIAIELHDYNRRDRELYSPDKWEPLEDGIDDLFDERVK